MKKVEITLKEATATIGKDNKPQVVFKDTIKKYLVASTKSQNNLVEELQEQGVIVGKQIAKDWFIDKSIAEKYATEIAQNSGIEEEYQVLLKDAIIKAFRTACITALEKEEK